MSNYNPGLAQELCERVAQGDTITSICNDEAMPHAMTFLGWVSDNPDLRKRYEQAKEISFDIIADSARQVARGNPGFSSGSVVRDKLIIDTDLKLLSKWSRKYGDKQQVEVTGKDGEPLSIRLMEIQQRLLKDVTPEPLLLDNNP